MTGPWDEPADWSYPYPAYSGVDPPPPPAPVAPPPQPRPPSWVERHLPRLLVPVLVAVLVAGAGLLLWSRTLDDDGGRSHGERRTSLALPPPYQPPPPPAAPRPPPKPCNHPVPGAVTPAGWVQVGSRLDLAYDVPSTWTVEECDVIVGWERPCPNGPFGTCVVQTMSAAAGLADPECDGGKRIVTGLDPNARTADRRAAAKDRASRVRKIYASDDHIPTVQLSDPVDLTIGGMPAVEIVATVTDVRPSDSCHAPSARHVVVALTAPRQSDAIVFVASVEQGYPGAPDPAVAERIAATLRPA